MTKHGMTHRKAREALEALALDVLDAGERNAVLAHVASCAECRDELAALSEAVGDLSYVVAAESMPAEGRDRVRKRLLARAGADRVRVTGDRPVVGTPHEPSLHHIMLPRTAEPTLIERHHWKSSPSLWVAMAASIIAIVTSYMLYQVSGQRDRISAAYRAVAAEARPTEMLDSLRSKLEERDRLIANLTGPEVAVVTLAASTPSSPSARMFWDQSVNAWTFVAHNLAKPKAGRTYQLWLVTASQKISAGTFTPLANGDAMVRATYALPKGALAAVAVTDEPIEGSVQPTTTPFIVGMASTR